MSNPEKRTAIKDFVAHWQNRGDEKQDTQTFWLNLLRNVYDVDDAYRYIDFEKPVMLTHKSFIDGYIASTKVLIEQKGSNINLLKGQHQSDGSVLSPYMQARRYASALPVSEHPRWIIVCNFKEFHIHDMNRPNDEPEILLLENLEKEYHRLSFLTDTGKASIQREEQLSIKAGELVGELYNALLAKYKDPTAPKSLKSLNILCVRLVFCLYAEDAGVFGTRNMFHDYLKDTAVKDVRRSLMDLFEVLNTPPADRDPYMDEKLLAFPYVNGGLFADNTIEIPRLDEAIVELILKRASADFDWSEISPTIFGAVFESTLNPETRRAGGMHYTSIENIHKVIDPLFLDDLRDELDHIRTITVQKNQEKALVAFQEKLASLTFLDPACGSGNFLTETYLSLRRLENESLRLRLGKQIALGFDLTNPIKVNIGQFYGIEINDFAVTVAKTALWIAESQMMKQTEDIIHTGLDFLPLKNYITILEANALQVDWETVVPKDELDYIMGNPPFVGTSYLSPEQRIDMDSIFPKKRGKLDYVSCWYCKAAQFIDKTAIKTAFVSTNSICQGEQATSLWEILFNEYHCIINFAVHPFKWGNESLHNAHVHVIIVGFSKLNETKKFIYENTRKRVVNNINQYLIDAPSIMIHGISKPLCAVPSIVRGSQATDNGLYLFTEKEKEDFIAKEPDSQKYFKRFMMGKEFIQNIKRYCLWMPDISPAELKNLPYITERIEMVKEFRKTSKNIQTQKSADIPWRFGQFRRPSKQYIAFAKVSSQLRRYIPFDFLTDDIIPGDKLFTIPNANLYMFGVLTSNIHNAWMRTVAGRLKSDYSYSTTIVYNNFPWPTPTEAQKWEIERTAQAILDARAELPDASLADLYDETLMPPALRKAHTKNDQAVMKAYGITKNDKEFTSESACVAMLMKMYQELTEK